MEISPIDPNKAEYLRNFLGPKNSNNPGFIAYLLSDGYQIQKLERPILKLEIS